MLDPEEVGEQISLLVFVLTVIILGLVTFAFAAGYWSAGGSS